MVLSAVPKDYQIIKDEQEPISHTEWKGYWIFMIPHLLLYLSSWPVFKEYHSFASNNRNVWSYISVASRDGEGSLPDLHAIIFWLCTPMTFLLGTRRKKAHSSRVSSLPRTSAWVSLNCWDLGTHEQMGTLLIAHCDSTEIEEGPAFHLLSLWGHHGQLPNIILSNSSHDCWWWRPQPYDTCCVLAVEYLPKTHIWKGVLSRPVVLGKPRNPGWA